MKTEEEKRILDAYLMGGQIDCFGNHCDGFQDFDENEMSETEFSDTVVSIIEQQFCKENPFKYYGKSYRFFKVPNRKRISELYKIYITKDSVYGISL